MQDMREIENNKLKVIVTRNMPESIINEVAAGYLESHNSVNQSQHGFIKRKSSCQNSLEN